MAGSVPRWLEWTPRVAAMGFAVFLSVFALDVFGEGRGLGATLLALVMHLLPSLLVVAMVVLAWRRAWLGAAGFCALGFLYMALAAGRLAVVAQVAIAGPLFLIGGLFAWRARRGTAPPRAA